MSNDDDMSIKGIGDKKDHKDSKAGEAGASSHAAGAGATQQTNQAGGGDHHEKTKGIESIDTKDKVNISQEAKDPEG